MRTDPRVASANEPQLARRGWPWRRLPPITTWIALGFIAWACGFIYRTSVVGIDGSRYFALFDDAMIAMRYAWNAAHGQGLVWNPGERVEGYTSLLMVLLMTPVNVWMTDKRIAVLAIQLFGVATMLGIAYLTRDLFRRLMPPGSGIGAALLPTLPFFLVLLYYPLVYFTLMGMETGLLTLCLLAGVVFSLRFVDGGTRVDGFAMAGSLGLAYLTRADSLLFTVLVFVFVIWERRPRPVLGTVYRVLLPPWAAFAAFPVGQQLFRWFYYGKLVPNTFVLKMEGFPLLLRIENGLAFVRPLGMELSVWVLLALLATVWRPTRGRILLLAITAVSVAYQIWIGGDAWRNWRFTAPAVPLLIVLAVAGSAALAGALARWREIWPLGPAAGPRASTVAAWERAKATLREGRRVIFLGSSLVLLALAVDPVGLSDPGLGEEQIALLLSGIFLVVLGLAPSGQESMVRPRATVYRGVIILTLLGIGTLLANQRFWREILFQDPPFDTYWNAERVNTAIALLETTTPEATIGVSAAGIIPYYTERRGVDFLGKADEYIARLDADVSGAMARGSMLTWPGHNKYDLYYSIGVRQPTYVQVLRWGSQDLSPLLGRLYVAAEYEGIHLYLRRDSPDVLWERLSVRGR